MVLAISRLFSYRRELTMQLRWLALLSGLLAICLAGCPGAPAGGERNAFQTLTEQFGTFSGSEDDVGGGAGVGAEGEFRSRMTVTLANNNPDAEVEVSFAAWVNVSSIRTAAQQDALLADGYVQITQSAGINLGTVFTLPPGTFVYGGPGVAGATAVRLLRAQAQDGDAATATVTTRDFTLITPDVILVLLEPPVSCESVAFRFTADGENFMSEPVGGGLGLFQGATGSAGTKILAQVDVYQCDPLMPGLFLKVGGGSREVNEYFEGEGVRFDFNPTPDADGNFATVTIMPASGGGGSGP
jgi:hypothetical protein